MNSCQWRRSVRVSGVAKKISIFGSTGSIGTSTLAIVESCPDQFDVQVLVAGTGAALLAEQALRHRPTYVGLASDEKVDVLRSALKGSGIEIVVGDAACTALAREPVDVVVAGIVGLAGLPAGSYSNTAGLTSAASCTACPVAAACSTGSTAPSACLPGSYSSQTRQQTCTLCPGGKFTPDSGSTACRDCTAGYLCVEGSSAPQPSPA